MYATGIDAGTSGVLVMISDLCGNVVATSYREYPCRYPRPGWSEQDIELVWHKLCEASGEAIARAGLEPSRIGSLGFSSQRGTFVCIDRNWNPLHRSIVWNDNRAAGRPIRAFREKMNDRTYRDIAGIAIDPHWALFKMIWVREHLPRVWEQTWKIVNGQEWFLHKLGSQEICSDPASLTLNGMMQIDTLDWSDRILTAAQIPRDKLPPVKPPMRQIGTLSHAAAAATGFAVGMPLVVGGGDQQCAAIGAGVIREGLSEVTIGTGGVMVAHADSRKSDPRGTVITGGHAIPGKWEIEGTQYSSGATLRWWRDTYAHLEARTAAALGLDTYDLITAQAAQAPAGCRGYLFFPFLSGQVTPHYIDSASGGALGLSFVHDRAVMARAVLEGITMEMRMIVEAIETVLKTPFDTIGLSGGGAKSPLWRQIQADVYGRPVKTYRVSECTALGAAILGATGAGIFASIDEAVDHMVTATGSLEPDRDRHAMYTDLYGVFRDTLFTLRDSGIYERLTTVQAKYWGD